MLDHIYTESIKALGVLHSFQGDYISDHRLVGIEIDKKKHNNRLDLLPRRNYTDLTTESFSKEFNNDTIIQHSKLEDIWTAFEKEITRTLDKLVPKVKKKLGAKPPCPWYNNSLLDQRRIVRRCERIYLKYRQQHQWIAFTRERNRYNTILNFNKRASLAKLVESAQGDSKKLFRVVSSLLGCKEDNPMPPSRRPEE